MSTVPETVTFSPVSTVAPASVQVLPFSTVSVPDVTVMTGLVESSTVTTRVAVVVLVPSVAV